MESKKSVNKNKLKELINKDIKDLLKRDIKINKKINNKKQKIKSKQINKQILSFDIDEDFIEVVVGKFYKDTLTISKCIQTMTPQNSIKDGKIINEEAIVDELKSILKENKIKAKYASFTTNSSLIINREMIIPKVEEDEMDTVIEYEISQYLPINLNDYIVQTLVLDEVEVKGVDKLKVHTICYPEKLARSYFDILEKLNLKPYSLDVKFNSLSKLINYSQEINMKDYEIHNINAFIDIGCLSTDINIYKEGKIDFTRIIKIGYRNVQSYSLDNKDISGVNTLVQEIDRIFQFYKNKNRGSVINNVYLLGEGSRLENIDKYMIERLGTNTEVINNVGFIEFSSKEDLSKDIQKYINAIGTIIRL